MLARYKGNFHAPGENRNRDPASFCQQVDDWTLLKITEKIIQKKKKPGLRAVRYAKPNVAIFNIYECIQFNTFFLLFAYCYSI